MRRVLLISLGITILPRSSTLRTMPVAFIYLLSLWVSNYDASICKQRTIIPMVKRLPGIMSIKEIKMLWWIIATFAAFFIKGLCGFTNGLVFTTILSFTTDNVNISPVSLVTSHPSNLILAWKTASASTGNCALP